jgi:hypothetical protein
MRFFVSRRVGRRYRVGISFGHIGFALALFGGIAVGLIVHWYGG